MEFDREVFDLMPSGSKTFNLIGLKMPSDKDIFFRAKQKETLDKYQAARRFMYELETDDWDHYFHKLEDENGNIYFQNVLKAQWYEAALLFYNAVVDLSWIACYISAEYFIYVDGKPVEVEGLTPIEEAYNALRKAEGYVQHPGVDGNPFEYLRKMCPQFSDTLDFVIAFWKDFADTPVRWKYNYLKHKGSLCYKEIQEREPHKIFSLQVNDKKCPSDIRDVQATINLIDAIEELRRFDNEKLFPYIESLFIQLEMNEARFSNIFIEKRASTCPQSLEKSRLFSYALLVSECENFQNMKRIFLRKVVI